MVVVLKNHDFKDAVSKIIERDYFPSHESNGGNTDQMSLTDFHQRTTNETSIQLQKSLELTGKTKLYKQSVIYASNDTSGNSKVMVTAELRNALFFPLSSTEVSAGTKATTASSISISSAMMPPPQKRKPSSRSLDRDNNGGCSITTLNTSKPASRTNSSSNALINTSATRFPTKAARRRHCSSSRKRRNCYQDDNTEQHWEGSTSTNNRMDDDSYFTDLDATTVDTYSLRSELRKAKVASNGKDKHQGPAPTSVRYESSYQLPQESSREVMASVIPQRRYQKREASDHQRRRTSIDTLQNQRPSHRLVKSLRSALKDSYKKQQEKVHVPVK